MKAQSRQYSGVVASAKHRVQHCSCQHAPCGNAAQRVRATEDGDGVAAFRQPRSSRADVGAIA